MARTSAKRRHITSEDLRQFISVSDPQVSPDGSRLLMCRSHVGDKNEVISNLWIVDTDGDSAPRQFTTGNRDSHGR